MSEFQKTAVTSPQVSLVDLLGYPYLNAVCQAKAFLENVDPGKFLAIAEKKVDFFPTAFQNRLDELVDTIGKQACSPLDPPLMGAATNSFTKATDRKASPLSSLGFIRVGEDGRAYLTSKSEHYHASLGHAFPGYQLIEHAKQLGIPNATHNNTRGYITRLLERELVRAVNGLDPDSEGELEAVLADHSPRVLNRVINLETGSLAVEAAVKMMLARFYRVDEVNLSPVYHGRIPVFLVIADRAGGLKANYHGTTMFTQFMRGLWPDLYQRMAGQQTFLVKQVKINDIDDFQRVFAEFDRKPYKVAGFIHEIVLMNYGGILLNKDYLTEAYAVCHQHDVPVLVDEIQSCIWSPKAFLFREYGLDPDFVSIGKGFPGGEYPASRVVTTYPMDNLSQFGALVTNGQEELASIAYLVTMKFLQVNQNYVERIGEYYHAELTRLAGKYPQFIQEIEGHRHLSTIFFRQPDSALKFIEMLNQAGMDISAQTYKAECPPAALTKIPVISSYKMVDFFVESMDQALHAMEVHSTLAKQ